MKRSLWCVLFFMSLEFTCIKANTTSNIKSSADSIKDVNIENNHYNKQDFLQITIPIQEIDTSNTSFYFITATGELKGVEIGLKLLINKSFQPLFGLKNGDIAQIRDSIESELENGLLVFGGEDILNNLINQMAREWGLHTSPLVNDLNCSGHFLWGDISMLQPYKNPKMMPIKIEPANYLNPLTKYTPLNKLYFKALGSYEIKFLEKNSETKEIAQVPFFIDIDLNNFTISISEKDTSLREEFLTLFYLDETYRQARLKNKIMLVTKSFTRANSEK
jgi:hypothetical protein